MGKGWGQEGEEARRGGEECGILGLMGSIKRVVGWVDEWGKFWRLISVERWCFIHQIQPS